jgi:hypothetical protein
MRAHSMFRTLAIAFGLTGIFAMTSGTALAAEEVVAEAVSALDPGVFRCTIGGGNPGSLLVRPDDTCKRFSVVLPGASNRFCPQGACVSCFSLHRDLGCILDP